MRAGGGFSRWRPAGERPFLGLASKITSPRVHSLRRETDRRSFPLESPAALPIVFLSNCFTDLPLLVSKEAQEP